MLMKFWHSFHMVSNSPWPLVVSIHVFTMVFNLSFGLNKVIETKVLAMKLIAMLILFLWWKDTARENLMEGWHSSSVTAGLKLGMIMFILSEVFFFISFFWSFFHYYLGPNVELGQSWPPIYISPMNPVGTPLLNTIILLSSGVTITSVHNYLLANNEKKAQLYLTMTWALGLYFLCLQFMEYKFAQFSMSDSSYGSIFFMGTGFHGMHVMIGSVYLMYTNFIVSMKWSNSSNLLSLDLSAWYWHFVDVVWIYLYLLMYWLPFV